MATFRSTDSSPKEQFINHQAGLDGAGGGSYIDAVVCREKDANTAWTSASDGTLEERRYYCQNWRADVSVVLTAGGLMVEWVKYSSYGSPFGLPGGDADSSGGTDAADTTQIQTWINTSAYDVRGDINLNGVVNASDKTTITNNYVGTTLGWNNLSAVGNRKGYAGYEWESQTAGYHVRNRILLPTLGIWNRRDVLSYVDGENLYEYLTNTPLPMTDPFGATKLIGNKFDAFIGSTHTQFGTGGLFFGPFGKDIFKPWWAPVPLFAPVDARPPLLRGRPSRIFTDWDVDSDLIGTTSAIYGFTFGSDPTVAVFSPGLRFSRTAFPNVTNRISATAYPGLCISSINIKASGKNPWYPILPAIDFHVQFDYRITSYISDEDGNCYWVVDVPVRGTHDVYPDYEAVIASRYFGYFYIAPDLCPSITNLSTTAAPFSGGRWGIRVSAPPTGSMADLFCNGCAAGRSRVE